MIFSVGDHIQRIKNGSKTQTRRSAERCKPGKLYAIQPGRCKAGINDGKFFVISSKRELRGEVISEHDAICEGSYTPAEYEELYEEMHPDWQERWCFEFRFIPNKFILDMWKYPSKKTNCAANFSESCRFHATCKLNCYWLECPILHDTLPFSHPPEM